MRKIIAIAGCFLLLAFVAGAQDRTIRGRVTDEKGIALANVSIVVKGTSMGTTSNSDGTFSLTVPSNANTLLVSFVGLADKEINLTSSSEYDITLTAGTRNNLDEVVVVGYGTQRRANITSSVVTVRGAEVENRPYTSVDQALQGKVAGLQAPLSNGQPGAAQPIRIRGIGSFTAGADPLFVIDGVIINAGDLTSLTTTANALAGINPNDIETVTVLKDAQATSIYGSRGANGVIVIVTKKGKPGKTKFRADAEAGYNKRARLPRKARFLNADEYISLLREGGVNAGLSPAAIDEFAHAFGEGSGVDTDWRDVIDRTGTQQQYNLSASGGDLRNQFFLSGSYFDQEATVIGSNFKRYSFRTNYKHIASDALNFIVNLTGSNSIQHTPNSGGAFSNPVGSLPFLRPTQNPFGPNGTLNISEDPDDPTGFSGGAFNPLFIANNDRYKTNTTLIQGSVGGEYTIINNLRFTSRFGIDYNVLEELNFWNQFHGDGVPYVGLLQTNNRRIFNWISTHQLDYSFMFGPDEKIRMDAKVGYESQKSKSYAVASAAQGFPPTNQLFLSVNAATPVTASATEQDFSFAGAYSAVTINYDSKYILSGSFRRDGSSRFSTHHLYGNFWSVGAAWNVDKEDFLSSAAFISSLKLRGSYGTSGNAEIGNYLWRQTIGFGSSYAGQPGGTFNSPGNLDLTWETTHQLDIGLDAGFFKDRLSVVFDFYRRESKGLLFQNPLSATVGFTSFINNIGKVENRGYELTLSGTPLQTRDFSWNLNFNISHNKNKLKALPEGKDLADAPFLLRVGHDIRTFFVREYAGVDPDNGDPLWFVDGTHAETTNVYNEAERQLIGTASPKYYGGLNSTWTYKGIDLTSEFVYNYGNKVRDPWIVYAIDGAYPDLNKYALNLERWQQPGDNTTVPKYVFGSTNNSSSFSTRFLNRGDFIRLRNVTIGYNFNSEMVKHLHISALRIYFRGTNLWTKTYSRNLTIDPEQGINSASNLNIFYTRTMTAGINVTL
ncbi:MAG: TonB-dependent receptor [Chitinophagaceae bacterium]